MRYESHKMSKHLDRLILSVAPRIETLGSISMMDGQKFLF
jgi:hypothetical protein